jgi:hypothetical protein
MFHSATASLFTPVLIFSTPALDTVTITATVTTVFDMTIAEGAVTLRGTLVLGTMPAFDTCIV